MLSSSSDVAGGFPTRERRALLVPEELGPYAALVKEWCKRKVVESPRWSADKWRRIAAIHGIRYADETPPAESGRDAA
ncbi:hypothetical protein ACFYOK_18540 [Microbispora bryophytorum]|uniref:hypothetical protein n=1 Tax=Microbispora bryophytorum TaxID=1460882 RepID=UPI003401704F